MIVSPSGHILNIASSTMNPLFTHCCISRVVILSDGEMLNVCLIHVGACNWGTGALTAIHTKGHSLIYCLILVLVY